MKHGRKEERDTALWLNDEQVSLLEEHKKRIKRQGEQQREHKRQEDLRRVKEAEEAREKEKDRLFEAVKARAESNARPEKERKRREEQQRAEQERRREEQQRAEQERRREEQQRERKRQEEQQREWRRFSNLSEKAMNPKVSACFPLPKLDEDDIRLVGEWNQSPQNNLDRKSLIEGESKDWELGRLLSARSAEKIAKDFYQSHGKTVEDVSITQIDENNNSDWKDYDLNVEGYPTDVKNSRKSRNSEDRYTEYCIPRFKTERRTNQEVRIAGVFSPYLWAFELLDKPIEHHQDREIQFLGETTLEKQQTLKSEFNDNDLVVDFAEPNRSNKYFLPPWVFDYPKYVYTERDKARKELKCFPNLTLLKDEFNLIPVAIAAGIDLTEILDNKALEHWEWSFLNQLRNRMALLHESYLGYHGRMLFFVQLIFSTRYDWGLPRWIIRLRMAQPKRLSTCWLAQLRAFSLSPMRCL